MGDSKNKRHRIKFFSVNDISIPYELKKAEDLLNSSDENNSYEINDLFEYYNIKLYLDGNLFLKSWSEVIKNNFIKKIENIFSILKERIIALSDTNLESILKDIEFKYYDDFWTLINQLNVYKKFDGQNFLDVLKRHQKQIRFVIQQKGIVDKLDRKIREFLLEYRGSAELLLAKLEEKHTLNEAPKYFFPKSLSLTDKEQIINSYLDADHINLNYVRLIVSSKDSTDLKLSAKTRLKAKKTSDELNNQMIESGYSWSIRYQVGISKDQVEPVVFNSSDNLLEVVYSEEFLNSCLDNDVKLFQLFSQLFFYLDEFNLITLVSKTDEIDSFERTFMKSKNSYETGEVFMRKENLSNMQLVIFEDYLKNNNNSLEQIVNSFIEYLNSLIDPIKIIFKIHSSSSSYVEKIRNLAPDYEFLLKQYKLLVEDGNIDLELIRIDSNPIRFSELYSFNDKKYIYSHDNQILYLKYVFFSNQSFLHYIKLFEDKYDNLFDLLLNENIKIEDFEEYQKEEIKKLINENYLKINQQGFIKLEKEVLMLVIYEIHKNEVVNYWNCSKIMRDEIDILLDSNLLKFENTLLTIQEKNYFNYYLNKKEFTNGHDLRNKYLHGTNSFSEDEHKMNYYRLLKIIILTLLKIEDDILLKRRSILK